MICKNQILLFENLKSIYNWFIFDLIYSLTFSTRNGERSDLPPAALPFPFKRPSMLSHLNVVWTAPKQCSKNTEYEQTMIWTAHDTLWKRNHWWSVTNIPSPAPLIIAIRADSLSMYQTVWAFARYTDHNIAAKRTGKTSSSWMGFLDNLKSLSSISSGTTEAKKETHLPPGLTNTPPMLPVLSSWLQAPSVKTNDVDNKLLSILMALASRTRLWRKVRLALISKSKSTTLVL